MECHMTHDLIILIDCLISLLSLPTWMICILMDMWRMTYAAAADADDDDDGDHGE